MYSHRCFIQIVFFLISLVITPIFAESVCKQDPEYDMLVANSFIQIKTKKYDLMINDAGRISYNRKEVPASPKITAQAKKVYQLVKGKLAPTEVKATTLMKAIHTQFINAVDQKLDGNQQIKTMLDNTYKGLSKFLHKAIYTENGITIFSAKHFHQIIDNASSRLKKESAKLFSKGLFTLSLSKNIKDIKFLSKEEWKKRKPEAKQFHKTLCDDLDNITKELNILLKQIQS